MRCLDELSFDRAVPFQELYFYPDQAVDDDEALRLEGDAFDLEPVVRDAVVLGLPFQPVCRDDCPGLCPECGVRLADVTDHVHEQDDPRWAALLNGPAPSTAPRPGTDRSMTSRKRASRGRPEEEDLAQQHAAPPLAVEGDRPGAVHLRPVQAAEAAAHRVSDLRHVQQATGLSSLKAVADAETAGVPSSRDQSELSSR